MGLGSFLGRFLAGMVVGVVAAALVVGCAASQRHAQRRVGAVLGARATTVAWANPAELSWLHKVGMWNVRLRGGLVTASSFVTEQGDLSAGATPSAVRLAVAPESACVRDFDTDVGQPPTLRLRSAWQLLRDACTHLHAFGDELQNAVSTRDERYLQAAGADARQGTDLLLRADNFLPPGESRPLPVVSAKTATSHIDPKLSRIARDLAHHRVEVRCWSRSDWSRLIREETTYTLNHIDGGAIAFAPILGSRDNLSPKVCGPLEALAYRRSLPRDPAGELALAQSLVALAHEPQHSRGIAVEAQAECYAIQLMRSVAEQLGAPPDYASTLQRLFWMHYDEELRSYRSPECRNDGKYDLHPSDPTFP
jgi:hypothetical protein